MKKHKKRREYQRAWQENYRKHLTEQGLKQIRLVIHKDFEMEIRELARKNIEDRRNDR